MKKNKDIEPDNFSKEDVLCPIKYLTQVLGGKWKLPVICILQLGGTVRFGKIKKKLDNVTNIMLSHTLKELERDGIIIRHQYNEVPPRVDYKLTEKGKSLIPAISALGDWANKYMEVDKIHSECEICMSEI